MADEAERDEDEVDLLLHTFGGLDPWLVYVLLALLVLGESTALLAVVLPGELALVVAGVLIAKGHASPAVVVAVAVVAAVAGHAVSYELGRRYGLSVLHSRLLRRYGRTLGAAASLVTRHGALAVFLGRWMNVGRILVPLLVGAGRMRYRVFAVYNVLGAMAWVLTFVTLGAVAGASIDVVERAVGHVGWSMTAAIVVGLLLLWVWRRTARRRRRATARPKADEDEVGCTWQVMGSSRPARGA